MSVVIAQDNNSRYSFFPNFSEIFSLCFFVITSVRVPPLSLRGYEGWATCGQNSLTGSPQDSLTSFFTQFLFSDLGFSFLWTRVPQLAALALHSSPKVGIVFLRVFAGNIEGTVHRSIDL